MTERQCREVEENYEATVTRQKHGAPPHFLVSFLAYVNLVPELRKNAAHVFWVFGVSSRKRNNLRRATTTSSRESRGTWSETPIFVGPGEMSDLASSY